MTVSVLVVDYESDVADLFPPTFPSRGAARDVCDDFANSGDDALGKLAGGVEPTLIVRGAAIEQSEATLSGPFPGSSGGDGVGLVCGKGGA